MSEIAAPAPASVVEGSPAAPQPGEAPKEGNVEGQEVKEAPPPTPKKYKFKANGRDIEATEEQVLKYAAQAFGSDENFKKAKAAREEVAQFQKRLESLKSKEAPIEERMQLMRELLGEDAEDVAEEAVYRRMKKAEEEAGMTAREKQLAKQAEEQARALQEYKQKELQQEAERTELRNRHMYEGLREQLSTVAMEAAKAMGMTNTPPGVIFNEMVPYLEQALESGQPVDPQVIAGLAVQNMRHRMSDLAGSLEGEALIGWLGEDIANKIRKADLARWKNSQGGNAPQVRQAPEPQRSGHPMGRMKEIEEMLRSK